MNYEEYVDNVKNICVIYNFEHGEAYINPNWRHILKVNGLMPDPEMMTIEQVKQMLQLDVLMYNGFVNKQKYVIQTIYSVIQELNKTNEETQTEE